MFRSDEVVSHYVELAGLTPCETHLFGRHLAPGIDILDLGVGAGRTTPALSGRGGRYVGVDLAPEMVDACRRRFPGTEFRVDDAAELDQFADDSFDAVVFAFNGIDYLHPDSARHDFLRAAARVLRPDGILIFSGHSPRGLLTFFDVRGVAWWRALLRQGKAAARSFVRMLRSARGPLWRGEGYVMDPEHGGLFTHVATPRRVRRELANHGFEHLETLPSTFPRRRPGVMVPWYYYAFRRQGDR